ncbi:MAG: DNA mismatch endonuclease Vsr [Gammaproteobacteria bacterium]|nr:DNA mismatch endonuclease Vsr [Gammaproteobacteria bacterium]
MIDVVDKATRSRMMSGIRSSNTKPEIIVRKAFHRLGYRFRLSSKIEKIKPDIILRKHKVAIFVHGCYWHQHAGCKLAYSDRSYSEKWLKKFSDNRDRDIRVTENLLSQGWRVVVIWECVTRNEEVFEEVIFTINNWIIENKSNYFETEYRNI